MLFSCWLILMIGVFEDWSKIMFGALVWYVLAYQFHFTHFICTTSVPKFLSKYYMYVDAF